MNKTEQSATLVPAAGGSQVERGVRPQIPAIVERFAAYYQTQGNGAWGSLHIVLDDGNVMDQHVEACRDDAAARGDAEGSALACILLLMTKSQRGRLSRKVDEWIACRLNVRGNLPATRAQQE